ncbi:peptidoglycan editing factor PgeF [Cardiobacterium hominis]|uniref:peptidoglycan editing factor PgeF n=1 Tax=Cardiobacterium hominis TaxID=2718 RepID=UPI00370D3149
MQALFPAEIPWLPADWPLTDRFVAGTSMTDNPLVTQGFNLARHVADEPSRVEAARARLATLLPETRWLWLSQVHSATVWQAADYQAGVEGDALVSREAARVPVVMTADCVPVLLADRAATVWAAVHAGWPGLHRGIIAATVATMAVAPASLFAWIGPCIRQANYEVDAPFLQRFVELDGRFAAAFAANRPGHWLADLPAIARMQLQDAGVPATQISDCGLCSFADSRFFSHRRNGAQAGRMATFIAPRL